MILVIEMNNYFRAEFFLIICIFLSIFPIQTATMTSKGLNSNPSDRMLVFEKLLYDIMPISSSITRQNMVNDFLIEQKNYGFPVTNTTPSYIIYNGTATKVQVIVKMATYINTTMTNIVVTTMSYYLLSDIDSDAGIEYILK